MNLKENEIQMLMTLCDTALKATGLEALPVAWHFSQRYNEHRTTEKKRHEAAKLEMEAIARRQQQEDEARRIQRRIDEAQPVQELTRA